MRANVVIHRDFAVAAVDPRIYGIHTGSADGPDLRAIVNPSHPAAGDDGIRTDVLDLLRAYRLPCLLGRVPHRMAGRAGDDAIRLDGFVDWCRRSGAEPMISLAYSAKDGRPAGFDFCEREGVHMWHLGWNGHDAIDTVIDGLRAADPTATLVLGPEAFDKDGALDTVLRLGRALDLVSVPTSGATADIGGAIDRLATSLDRAGIVDRTGRRIGVQVDHWGDEAFDAAGGGGPALRRALALNALIRRADRVRTAFAGHVISGLASLVSDRIGMGHRPSLYDPVLAGSIYGRGVSLMPAVRMAPVSDDDPETPLDVAAVMDEENDALTLFLANRSALPVPVEADLHGFTARAVAEFRSACAEPRLPGQRGPSPVLEAGRLSWCLPAGGYGLVRLARRN